MNIKKILLIAVCLVAVVGMSVMGTLAYLTDTTAVVNTFTMGNVDIKLDEALVDADGKALTGNDAGRTEEGNQYKLIPGKSYDKDPTVTVIKGSEESYVRMLVTMNCMKELDEIFAPDGAKLEELFGGYSYIDNDPNKPVWVYAGKTEEAAANTITYEFRYHEPVGAVGAAADKVLEPLFTTFNVPGELDAADLKKLMGDESTTDDDFKITVNAHAIQATGFEADTANNLSAEDVAWKAFDAQVETTAGNTGAGSNNGNTPTT